MRTESSAGSSASPVAAIACHTRSSGRERTRLILGRTPRTARNPRTCRGNQGGTCRILCIASSCVTLRRGVRSDSTVIRYAPPLKHHNLARVPVPLAPNSDRGLIHTEPHATLTAVAPCRIQPWRRQRLDAADRFTVIEDSEGLAAVVAG